MKKINSIFISIFSIFAQNSDFDNYLNKTYPDFKVKQLQLEKFDSLNNFILIDTRETEEFNVSYIKGAINIPYSTFTLKNVKSLDINDTIILYCSVGYRSSKIADKLIEANFKNIYNLYGGIFHWVNNKRKLVKKNIETEKLHVYSKKWGKFVINSKIDKVF